MTRERILPMASSSSISTPGQRPSYPPEAPTRPSRKPLATAAGSASPPETPPSETREPQVLLRPSCRSHECPHAGPCPVQEDARGVHPCRGHPDDRDGGHQEHNR